MVIYQYGNVFDSRLLRQAGAFIHLCNPRCIMGSGVALGVKTYFPELYQADQQTKHLKDYEKMGGWSTAWINRNNGFRIQGFNLYAQKNIWEPQPRIDYMAFERGLRSIVEKTNHKIYIAPPMGTGRAGGDEIIISDIYQRVFHDRLLYIVRDLNYA